MLSLLESKNLYQKEEIEGQQGISRNFYALILIFGDGLS
jgi:hypothetical protein